MPDRRAEDRQVQFESSEDCTYVDGTAHGLFGSEFVHRWTNGVISGTERWLWLVQLGYGIAVWWICHWRARAIDVDLKILSDLERDLGEDHSRSPGVQVRGTAAGFSRP